MQKKLVLGNLDAQRDWGYAGDYVKAIWWLMLQQNEPDDYVIATGETHSVKEFVELAFSYVSLTWQNYVVIEERLYGSKDSHSWEKLASLAQVPSTLDVLDKSYTLKGSWQYIKFSFGERPRQADGSLFLDKYGNNLTLAEIEIWGE